MNKLAPDAVGNFGIAFHKFWRNLDVMKVNQSWTTAIAALLSLLGACWAGASYEPGTVVAWGGYNRSETNVPPGLSNVVAIAGGQDNAMALKRDGTVVAWGSNDNTNVPSGLTGVVAIAAGGGFSLALKLDGMVVPWGSNLQGRTNVPIGLSNVIAIAAGSGHGLALRNGGTVVAWGDNSYGQTNVPTGLSNVISIAAGYFTSLALQSNGTVAAWGSRGFDEANVPVGLGNVIAIAGGACHCLALKSDGTVSGWGWNGWGQTNPPSDLSNVIAISVGEVHSLALKRDGTVVAWGSNLYGETNIPTGLSNVVGIAGAGNSSLALIEDVPLILAHPQSQRVVRGTDVAFSVRAAGMPPLRLNYQWYFNGTNAISGATNSVLTLTNVQATNTGAYFLVISNATGVATSAVAQLYVECLLIYANGDQVTNSAITLVGEGNISMQSVYPNGSIFYTLDGSQPSFLSEWYSGPFTLEQSANLRAVTYNADFLQSWEAPSIQVTIIPTYSVTTSTHGGGSVGLVPPGGTYVSNSTVAVTAAAASGWTFLQWLGDASGTNPSVHLTMNRSQYLEAVFGTSLATTVAGSGSVLLYPPSPYYPLGTVVRLTAIPQSGSFFAVWGNAAHGNSNPLLFTITNPTPTVSAMFAVLGGNQWALTVIPDGFGQVTISPTANAYEAGTTVLLSAIPDAGQTFVGWSGDATGTQNPFILTMNTNKIITATFTKRPTLSTPNGLAGLTPDGFRMHLAGEFGAVYEMLSSSNLMSWSALGFVTNVYGTVQFTDATATNFDHQFYRARAQ